MSEDKKKKVPMRRKAYELMEEISQPAQRNISNLSPVDQLLFEEEQNVVRDAKKEQLDEIVARRRIKRMQTQKELDKLEREAKIGGGDITLGDPDPRVVMTFAGIEDDQKRNTAISVYNAMKLAMANSGGSATEAMLIPMAFQYAQNRPGGSQEDMSTYADKIINAMRIGRDMSKEGGTTTETLITLMRDLTKQVSDAERKADTARLEAELRSIKESLSGGGDSWESFWGNYEKMKAAGVIGGQGLDAQTQIALKTMDHQMAIQLKQLDIQDRKALAELQEGHERTNLIKSAITKFGGAIAKGVEDTVAEGEDGTTLGSGIQILDCPYNCGGQIPIPAKHGKTVYCPTCGEHVNINEG